MNVEEAFKIQLENNKSVTKETLEISKHKFYTNGTEIKVGDFVYYAYLAELIIENSKVEAIKFNKMLLLNKEDFKDYRFDSMFKNNKKIPIVFKKEC